MSGLPNKWTRLPLGEVGRWLGGGTPSKANPLFWTNGTIPWVSPKDMKCPLITDAQDHITEDAVKQSATNLAEAGSVLLVVRSGILQHTLPVAIAQRQVALNQDLKAVLPRDNVRSDYLALALKAFEREILHTCTKAGTTVQSLELPVFLRFEIPVAPLPEQKRIVAEIEKQFTRLDAGIAALRRVQANLKRYRAAILKAACEGRLVPTEAKLARREGRLFDTGRQLLESILKSRRENWGGRGKCEEPTVLNPASLPQLPAGWVWANVEQLRAFSLYGPRFSSANYAEQGYIVLRTSDISASGKVDITKAPRLQLSKEEFEKYRVHRGDLLVTRTGSLGTVAVFDDEIDAIPGAYLIQFRLLTSPTTTRYLFYFLKSPFGQDYLAGKGAGIGRPNLNAPAIEALNVPLPPIVEQARIVSEIDRRLSVIEELESTVRANLQRAARLRHAILRKAFEGGLVLLSSQLSNSPDDLGIPKFRPPRRHFARALLSAEIVHELHGESTFGRTKHQKIFHLCEYIAKISEIDGQYHREAAGPLDNKLIYANEAELKKQKWYEERPRSDGYGHAYRPLSKAGTHRTYLERYWPDKLAQIKTIIDLMRGWNTERCEIFSTVYAAWNDLILWKKEVTEEAILNEILNHWHDAKRRIPEERWRKAIAWIKDRGFAPTGFGKPTREI